MQWPHLILPVKKWVVVDFIARWHHLFYKFVQYSLTDIFSTMQCLNVPKYHANCFRRFEDVDSQTQWPRFLAHPVDVQQTDALWNVFRWAKQPHFPNTYPVFPSGPYLMLGFLGPSHLIRCSHYCRVIPHSPYTLQWTATCPLPPHKKNPFPLGCLNPILYIVPWAKPTYSPNGILFL